MSFTDHKITAFAHRVADLPDAAAVRDTQNREAGHLTFARDEWVALLSGVRSDLR